MSIQTISLMIKSRNKNSIYDKFLTILRYLFVKSLKYLNFSKTFSIRDNPNIKFIIRPGCSISEKLYIIGLYDYNGMSFLLEQLKESDIFYDIGANIGPFSLLASKITTNIFAFEAHPITTNRLKNNFKLNDIDDNRAINVAISNEVGKIYFEDDPGSASNAIINKSDEGLLVKVSTIDMLSKKQGIPRFIKIDTEGNELNVFKGMKNSLSSGMIDYISFEANGLSSSQDLTKIYNQLVKQNFLIGLLDFDKKRFYALKKLGEKAKDGDYYAISENLQIIIKSQGYEIIF